MSVQVQILATMVRVKQRVAGKKILKWNLAKKTKGLGQMTVQDMFHIFKNEPGVDIPVKDVHQLFDAIRREMFSTTQLDVELDHPVTHLLAEFCSDSLLGKFSENGLLKVQDDMRFGEYGSVIVGKQLQENGDGDVKKST